MRGTRVSHSFSVFFSFATVPVISVYVECTTICNVKVSFFVYLQLFIFLLILWCVSTFDFVLICLLQR